MSNDDDDDDDDILLRFSKRVHLVWLLSEITWPNYLTNIYKIGDETTTF